MIGCLLYFFLLTTINVVTLIVQSRNAILYRFAYHHTIFNWFSMMESSNKDPKVLLYNLKMQHIKSKYSDVIKFIKKKDSKFRNCFDDTNQKRLTIQCLNKVEQIFARVDSRLKKQIEKHYDHGQNGVTERVSQRTRPAESAVVNETETNTDVKQGKRSRWDVENTSGVSKEQQRTIKEIVALPPKTNFNTIDEKNDSKRILNSKNKLLSLPIPETQENQITKEGVIVETNKTNKNTGPSESVDEEIITLDLTADDSDLIIDKVMLSSKSRPNCKENNINKSKKDTMHRNNTSTPIEVSKYFTKEKNETNSEVEILASVSRNGLNKSINNRNSQFVSVKEMNSSSLYDKVRTDNMMPNCRIANMKRGTVLDLESGTNEPGKTKTHKKHPKNISDNISNKNTITTNLIDNKTYENLKSAVKMVALNKVTIDDCFDSTRKDEVENFKTNPYNNFEFENHKASSGCFYQNRKPPTSFPNTSFLPAQEPNPSTITLVPGIQLSCNVNLSQQNNTVTTVNPQWNHTPYFPNMKSQCQNTMGGEKVNLNCEYLATPHPNQAFITPVQFQQHSIPPLCSCLVQDPCGSKIVSVKQLNNFTMNSNENYNKYTGENVGQNSDDTHLHNPLCRESVGNNSRDPRYRSHTYYSALENRSLTSSYSFPKLNNPTSSFHFFNRCVNKFVNDRPPKNFNPNCNTQETELDIPKHVNSHCSGPRHTFGRFRLNHIDSSHRHLIRREPFKYNNFTSKPNYNYDNPRLHYSSNICAKITEKGKYTQSYKKPYLSPPNGLHKKSEVTKIPNSQPKTVNNKKNESKAIRLACNTGCDKKDTDLMKCNKNAENKHDNNACSMEDEKDINSEDGINNDSTNVVLKGQQQNTPINEVNNNIDCEKQNNSFKTLPVERKLDKSQVKQNTIYDKTPKQQNSIDYKVPKYQNKFNSKTTKPKNKTDGKALQEQNNTCDTTLNHQNNIDDKIPKYLYKTDGETHSSKYNNSQSNEKTITSAGDKLCSNNSSTCSDLDTTKTDSFEKRVDEISKANPEQKTRNNNICNNNTNQNTHLDLRVTKINKKIVHPDKNMGDTNKNRNNKLKTYSGDKDYTTPNDSSPKTSHIRVTGTVKSKLSDKTLNSIEIGCSSDYDSLAPVIENETLKICSSDDYKFKAVKTSSAKRKRSKQSIQNVKQINSENCTKGRVPTVSITTDNSYTPKVTEEFQSKTLNEMCDVASKIQKISIESPHYFTGNLNLDRAYEIRYLKNKTDNDCISIFKNKTKIYNHDDMCNINERTKLKNMADPKNSLMSDSHKEQLSNEGGNQELNNPTNNNLSIETGDIGNLLDQMNKLIKTIKDKPETFKTVCNFLSLLTDSNSTNNECSFDKTNKKCSLENVHPEKIKQSSYGNIIPEEKGQTEENSIENVTPKNSEQTKLNRLILADSCNNANFLCDNYSVAFKCQNFSGDNCKFPKDQIECNNITRVETQNIKLNNVRSTFITVEEPVGVKESVTKYSDKENKTISKDLFVNMSNNSQSTVRAIMPLDIDTTIPTNDQNITSNNKNNTNDNISVVQDNIVTVASKRKPPKSTKKIPQETTKRKYRKRRELDKIQDDLKACSVYNDIMNCTGLRSCRIKNNISEKAKCKKIKAKKRSLFHHVDMEISSIDSLSDVPFPRFTLQDDKRYYRSLHLPDDKTGIGRISPIVVPHENIELRSENTKETHHKDVIVSNFSQNTEESKNEIELLSEETMSVDVNPSQLDENISDISDNHFNECTMSDANGSSESNLCKIDSVFSLIDEECRNLAQDFLNIRTEELQNPPLFVNNEKKLKGTSDNYTLKQKNNDLLVPEIKTEVIEDYIGTQVASHQQNIHKTWKNPKVYIDMLNMEKLEHFYKCMEQDCTFTHDRREVFAEHLQCHVRLDEFRKRSKKGWHICPYCPEQITDIPGYLSHLHQHHGNSHIQCKFCFYRCSTFEDGFLHQRKQHMRRRPELLQCHNGLTV